MDETEAKQGGREGLQQVEPRKSWREHRKENEEAGRQPTPKVLYCPPIDRKDRMVDAHPEIIGGDFHAWYAPLRKGVFVKVHLPATTHPVDFYLKFVIGVVGTSNCKDVIVIPLVDEDGFSDVIRSGLGLMQIWFRHESHAYELVLVLVY